jgi:hypothetical protein
MNAMPETNSSAAQTVVPLQQPSSPGLGLKAEKSTAAVYWAVVCVGLVGAAGTFFELKHALIEALARQTSPYILTIFILLVALTGSWLRAADLTAPARILYRTSSALISVYLFASYVPMLSTTPADISAWFKYAPHIGIAAAALSFWLPTFALVPFGFLVMQKALTSQIWHIPISPTDWLPIVESTSFLLISASFLTALIRLVTAITGFNTTMIQGGRMRLPDVLVIVTVGIHFANYEWSAFEKVLLDGGPLSWVLHNRTDVLIDVAVESGFITVGYGFPFSSFVRDLATQSVLPLNAMTLIIQIACVFVFWRRALIVVLTLLFDVTHITIFALTGIFFWKWIIFNFAIVAAVSRIDRSKIPFAVGALGLLACLTAGKIFFVAKLGWYDTRSFNHFYVLAVTDDGREINVPTNFFGPASVAMAQMDYAHAWPDALPTGTWGATTNFNVMKAGMACTLLTDQPASHDISIADVAHFIDNWHSAMLAEANPQGRILYDIYPHHIWSDPRRYKEFAALDLRQVIGYKVRRDSGCIDTNNRFGRPKPISRAETFVAIRKGVSGAELHAP